MFVEQETTNLWQKTCDWTLNRKAKYNSETSHCIKKWDLERISQILSGKHSYENIVFTCLGGFAPLDLLKKGEANQIKRAIFSGNLWHNTKCMEKITFSLQIQPPFSLVLLHIPIPFPMAYNYLLHVEPDFWPPRFMELPPVFVTYRPQSVFSLQKNVKLDFLWGFRCISNMSKCLETTTWCLLVKIVNSSYKYHKLTKLLVGGGSFVSSFIQSEHTSCPSTGNLQNLCPRIRLWPTFTWMKQASWTDLSYVKAGNPNN